MSEINVQPQNFNRIKSLLKFVANNKLYIVTILVSFMLGFLVSKIIRTGLFVKGGVEVFNCLIIILVIAALIYSIAYKFIINIEMRQYKYLAISFDLEKLLSYPFIDGNHVIYSNDIGSMTKDSIQLNGKIDVNINGAGFKYMMFQPIMLYKDIY